MRVEYRTAFLKDLKKLKGQPIYDQVYHVVFEVLPEAKSLRDIPDVKHMVGYSRKYRIRLGDYRVGIEYDRQKVEVMRVLHRREFYRYFPGNG